MRVLVAPLLVLALSSAGCFVADRGGCIASYSYYGLEVTQGYANLDISIEALGQHLNETGLVERFGLMWNDAASEWQSTPRPDGIFLRLIVERSESGDSVNALNVTIKKLRGSVDSPAVHGRVAASEFTRLEDYAGQAIATDVTATELVASEVRAALPDGFSAPAALVRTLDSRVDLCASHLD